MPNEEAAKGQLWYGDLRHLGDLFKCIRARTQLPPSDVAYYAGIDPGTVTKLEKEGGGSRETFEKYAQALLGGGPPLNYEASGYTSWLCIPSAGSGKSVCRNES